MKIAYNHQIFNWQPYGGISRYYSLLAKELLNLKQDIGIFAGIHQNKYLKNLPANKIKGLELNKYPPKSGHFFQLLNHYLTNRQIKEWQPDLIHETYYSNYSFTHSHATRITTVHDMIHELFPHIFPNHDKTIQWKRKTLDRVDHVICISNNTKNDLIKLTNFDEKKISVVYHGIDTSSFRHELEITNNHSFRPFLLFVGERTGYKNFNSILKAFAASKKLKKDFDLIAFGGKAFNFEEKEIISSLRFSENQIRHVVGNDQELVKHYQNATAFIYPSYYEGFGFPPLEAMACSCPVISSNTSSMPEIIGDAAEFFSPFEQDDIQHTIEQLVYSPKKIDKLKQQGLERVQHFSWKKCAKETLAVYKKIASLN